MKQFTRQAAAFGSVGILNTAIGLGVIWFSMLLGATPVVANVLGYAVGLALSFSLNRSFTFRNSERVRPQLLRFAMAFAIAWGCNIAALLAGIHWAGLSAYLMQIGGMVTYTVLFFLLCRSWVFRPENP